MTERYKIMDCSLSCHCCFEYTVVDTTKPDMIGGEHYKDEKGFHYETVCECFEYDDAKLVCDALNARGKA